MNHAVSAFLLLCACIQPVGCVDSQALVVDGEPTVTWIGLNGRRLSNGDSYRLPLDRSDRETSPGAVVREALRLDNVGDTSAVIRAASFLPSPDAHPAEFALVMAHHGQHVPPTFPIELPPGSTVNLDVVWLAPHEPSPSRLVRRAHLRVWLDNAAPMDVAFEGRVRLTTPGAHHEPIGWPTPPSDGTAAPRLLTATSGSWWASSADSTSTSVSELWHLDHSGQRQAWRSQLPGIPCLDADGAMLWLSRYSAGLIITRVVPQGAEYVDNSPGIRAAHWPTGFDPTACRSDGPGRLLVVGAVDERPALARLDLTLDAPRLVDLSTLTGDELASTATDVAIAGDRVLVGWRAGARGAIAVLDRATLRPLSRLQIDAPVEQLTELSDGTTAALLDAGSLYDLAHINIRSELDWRRAIDTDWLSTPSIAATPNGSVMVFDAGRLWRVGSDGQGVAHHELLPASVTTIAGVSGTNAWIAAQRDDIPWRWQAVSADTGSLDSAYEPRELARRIIDSNVHFVMGSSDWHSVTPPVTQGRWYHVPQPQAEDAINSRTE